MQTSIHSSISEVVYQKLKRRIIAGKLRLGQRIMDAELIEEFNVSRTPIREALLKLKGEGLIEIHPRSGTFVFRFSEDDLTTLCETRIVIEQGALRKACKCNSIRLLNELTQNLQCQKKLIQSDIFDDYLKLDKEFHNIFFVMAKNYYLEQAFTIISDKINVLRSYLNLTRDFIVNSICGHESIVDFIVNEDIEGACKRLEKHIYGAFNKEFLTHLTSVSQKNVFNP